MQAQAGEMAMQQLQMETQAKMQIKPAEIQGMMQKMQQEAELKSMLMELELLLLIQKHIQTKIKI